MSLYLEYFAPKPGEKIENTELSEISGDEDNRLRKEYESVTFYKSFT